MGVAGANGSDGGARKTGTLSSAGNADKGANGGDASASTSLTTTSAAAATGLAQAVQPAAAPISAERRRQRKLE